MLLASVLEQLERGWGGEGESPLLQNTQATYCTNLLWLFIKTWCVWGGVGGGTALMNFCLCSQLLSQSEGHVQHQESPQR